MHTQYRDRAKLYVQTNALQLILYVNKHIHDN